MKENRLRIAALAALLLGGVLVGRGLLGRDRQSTNVPTPTPTNTPEPIVPTRTPAPTLAATETTVVETPTAVIEAATPTPRPLPEVAPEILARFGVAGSDGVVAAGHALGLPFSNYLSWTLVSEPIEPAGTEFWQMVKVNDFGPNDGYDAIEQVLATRKGGRWILGNEPDVIWQDNVSAETYATVYHDIYTFIKALDPSAQIAPAGISQSTPLRRQYLDTILQTYLTEYGEPLPADFWTIHAFVLREEADSWGVDIPPGMDVITGELYEIEEHGDMVLMQQNLIDFRTWMAENGYQNMPLAVTEYGILLPNDYGFPDEFVAQYMHESFDFFLTAQNEETGYPEDDHKLIQYWFWYSMTDTELYPTGNLYSRETKTLTPLGDAYIDYFRE